MAALQDLVDGDGQALSGTSRMRGNMTTDTVVCPHKCRSLKEIPSSLSSSDLLTIAHFFVARPHYLQRMLKLPQVFLRI
jgi:hypothetical protein